MLDPGLKKLNKFVIWFCLEFKFYCIQNVFLEIIIYRTESIQNVVTSYHILIFDRDSILWFLIMLMLNI